MKHPVYASLFGLIGLLLAVSCAHAEAQSQRILFLLVHGFNRMEHFESLYSLVAMGYSVDVASFAAGTVLLDPQNKAVDASGRDAYANMAMRDVTDIRPYLGLVIPGGYSAGNMERDLEAIRIVQAFYAADKPIGAICHAARLLGGAGIAAGRVVTGWNEIASEIPDAWVGGDLGTYVDEEVVVDGPIISCRYPNDVGPWLRVFSRHLAERGGIRIAGRHAAAVFIGGQLLTGHQRQMIQLGARNNDLALHIVHDANSMANAAARVQAADVVFVAPDAASAALLESPAGEALLQQLGNPPVHRLADQPSYLQLREAVAIAHPLGRPLPEDAPPAADAVIAIAPGFDDRVAIAMDAFLRFNGMRPVYISHERGWVRGLQGLPVFAEGSYEQPPALAEKLLVVAPGGLWPREQADARQARQPDWLRGQAHMDARRAQWITDHYKAGAVLVVFGFDSLYVTADDVFSGVAVAASEQTVWSFGRHSAAKYARNVAALRSDERLFSARGFAALPELMRLLADYSHSPD